MPTISLDYVCRPQFEPFHKRKQRWAAIVAHRRAGKTVACVMDAIDAALRCPQPHGRYAYVAPFLAQAKEVAWDYLKRFAQPITKDKNEAELWVELINGARIRIHGADNPDRLRGAYLDGVTLDEYADMRPSVWGEVIRPMLADRQGWATFIGTPKGKNGFWDLWQGALKDDSWFTLMLKASETGLIDPGELAALKADMTKDEYDQEMECSFEAAIKGAFYADELRIAQQEGRICRIPIDRAVRVHTAWDLGVSDSTAIWFIQCVGRERRLVDYYEASGVGLPHYAELLEKKKAERNWQYADHWFPHDIEHKELSTGRSRVDTLRSLGIQPRVVEMHNVLDGINTVRRMLDRTWIDPEWCDRGLEALKQYRREYDDKLKDWKMRPLHDWSSHGADALRTFAAGFDEPMTPETRRRRHFGKGAGPSAWAA